MPILHATFIVNAGRRLVAMTFRLSSPSVESLERNAVNTARMARSRTVTLRKRKRAEATPVFSLGEKTYRQGDIKAVFENSTSPVLKFIKQ